MRLRHPNDLFGRAVEWKDISSFVGDSSPGLQVAIVYGRRRQGKSYLLRRLAHATGGFYYQALEHESAQALAEFGSSLGAYQGVGRIALANWTEAVQSFRNIESGSAKKTTRSRTGSEPLTIILDEFPYLLAKAPELPSIIQRAVDGSRDNGWPPIRLILCGSALSIMSEIMSGQGALRGRVRTQLLIEPFDYRAAAEFWKIADSQLALKVHSVLGGTPGYRDMVRRLPQKLEEFDDWVIDEILNPATAMFREDEWLLGEESSLTDRALYLSVLSAVAAGNSSQSQIAAILQREQTRIQHPLEALVRTGFLNKDEDVLRQRRPSYRIIEPIIRFHQAIRYPDQARYEDRFGQAAWQDAAPTFESLILGPHFEQLAREFVRKFAGRDVVGKQLSHVGTTVLPDRENRSAHEVDIVALARRTNAGGKAVALIGEVKLRELHCGDLARLEQIRELVPGTPKQVSRMELVLASATGFDSRLEETAATRPDVKLIELGALYGR